MTVTLLEEVLDVMAGGLAKILGSINLISSLKLRFLKREV